MLTKVTNKDVLNHRMALADCGVETVQERTALTRIFTNTFGRPASLKQIMLEKQLPQQLLEDLGFEPNFDEDY